ncbi:MAG: hypothetical protein ACREKR_14125 [Candidatus Methylomirabilales bacterium]
MLGAVAAVETTQYHNQPSPDTLGRLRIAEGLGRDFAYRADAVRETLIGMARMAGSELSSTRASFPVPVVPAPRVTASLPPLE